MSTRAPARLAFRAMATDVVVQADGALRPAERVFRRVEQACSRFDAGSDLSRANAAPDGWHEVAPELAAAVRAAHAAHRATGGVFDPRVIGALEALGYDRSLAFDGQDRGPARAPVPTPRTPWAPQVDGSRVHLGGARIDLGGIGKGLAVGWARDALGTDGPVLVDAGGDCWLGGAGPAGEGWRVGVEDPQRPGGDPVLVLALTDLACATSSTRRRRWTAGGDPVHHLVDPATGRSGGAGLAAVTVVHEDPATAEVWSKALLLGGLPLHTDLPVACVTTDGRVGTTAALAAHVVWRAPRG